MFFDAITKAIKGDVPTDDFIGLYTIIKSGQLSTRRNETVYHSAGILIWALTAIRAKYAEPDAVDVGALPFPMFSPGAALPVALADGRELDPYDFDTMADYLHSAEIDRTEEVKPKGKGKHPTPAALPLGPGFAYEQIAAFANAVMITALTGVKPTR